MKENIVEKEEFVPTKAKVGFAFLNSGSALLSGLAFGSIDLFYQKIYGADLRIIALSWLLFIVWNAINDPLLGILEDRTNSKLGRRVPYLRYGALPYAIAFIVIWIPFATTTNFGLEFFQNLYPGITGRDVALFWNHLLMLYIFDTLFSMIGLIAYQLPAEMAITAHARTKILVYSTILGIPVMILPLILPTLLLGGDNPSKDMFLTVMFIMGIIGGILVFISSYLVKENEYTRIEEPLGFWESIKETFKNKPFLILEVYIFSAVVVQESLFSGITQLFDYVLVLNDNLLITILAAVPVVILLIYGLLWVIRNIPKYGIRKIMMFGCTLSISGFFAFFVVGLAFGSKAPFEILIYPLGLMLFGLIINLMNNATIMSETVDNDEILTGKRRETTYSGVNALLTKPAVSIAHFLTLTIMTLFGYNKEISNPSEQNPTVSTGVLMAFTIVPIICISIALLALKFFPLDGEKWQEQKRHLQEVHKQKEKEYVEMLKKEGKF